MTLAMLVLVAESLAKAIVSSFLPADGSNSLAGRVNISKWAHLGHL